MSDSYYPGPAMPNGFAPTPRPAEDPGRVMGIIGLVLSIVMSWIGLIVSIIAFRTSKKSGFHNGVAKAGIIVGCITTAIAIIGIIGALSIGGTVMDKCDRLGPGVHEVNGVTYTCS